MGPRRQPKYRQASAALLAALAFASARPSRASAAMPDELHLYTQTHAAMGTTFSLYLYVHSQAEADTDAAMVFDEVDRIEDLLSNYREASELSRINREAFAAPVTTDPETFRFLETSLAWSARSCGAFDITVGKLMKTWGFFAHGGRVPSDAELAATRADTGWQHVLLSKQERTVRFTSRIELDPGGIGKGYAVERAIDLLRTQHVSAALLSAGSSTIYALGAPPGERGWLIHVPQPDDRNATISDVTLRDTSLSTANCSEKHFVRDGHLYCHIMDPRTLRPVEDTLQVTVTAPSATDSDALSNVLFVQRPDQDHALLRDLPADAALLVFHRPQGPACLSLRWPGSTPVSSFCAPATPPQENSR